MSPIPVMFWRVPSAQHDVKCSSDSSLLPSQLAQWHDELTYSLAIMACREAVTRYLDLLDSVVGYQWPLFISHRLDCLLVITPLPSCFLLQ
jgi:hypothetical protein